ncbi:MAG: hypothetical protein BGO08_03735 [Altererythrobacter sp. 66-12]|nr:MAG: hypothetical protein BGO08_03735 [Altererythrobacter sp. 66-12]
MLDGQSVHDTVPLGAVLRYFDGTPQPPARFTRKLRDWKRHNSTGRLIQKSPPSAIGASTYPAEFILHEGTYTSGGTPIIVVRCHYFVTTDLHFEILERPQPGMVRVLSRWNGRDELRHLAPDMAAAEAWMQANRYSDLVTEVVGADELPVQLRRAA